LKDSRAQAASPDSLKCKVVRRKDGPDRALARDDQPESFYPSASPISGGKDAERWIDVEWGEDIRGQFRTIVEVQIRDDRGALGRVAAEIAASEANIVNVTMDEEPDRVATIRFTLQVRSRQHLAQVFRQVRKQADVTKITRL
jgi:(p)ppGpp synthase/HD superfamily hydrolase